MDKPFSTSEARISTINAALGAGSAAFTMLGVGASAAAGAFDSTADVTAPGTISDLLAQGATDDEVILTWTAPGSDGFSADTVATYDVRYATSEIASATFSAATQFPFSVAGRKATGGAIQAFTITGLDPNTTYYFAVKATDAAGNTALMSNVTSYKTARIDGVGTADP